MRIIIIIKHVIVSAGPEDNLMIPNLIMAVVLSLIGRYIIIIMIVKKI